MRTTGTVKWFSDDTGFGFNTPDGGDADRFVHHGAIQAEARVEFDIVRGTTGPAAQNVVKLG